MPGRAAPRGGGALSASASATDGASIVPFELVRGCDCDRSMLPTAAGQGDRPAQPAAGPAASRPVTTRAKRSSRNRGIHDLTRQQLAALGGEFIGIDARGRELAPLLGIGQPRQEHLLRQLELDLATPRLETGTEDGTAGADGLSQHGEIWRRHHSVEVPLKHPELTAQCREDGVVPGGREGSEALPPNVSDGETYDIATARECEQLSSEA
jgi:hypothetical protein